MGLGSLAPTIEMYKLSAVQSLLKSLRSRKPRMHVSTYPVRHIVYISDGVVEVKISDNSDADLAAIRGDWIVVGNDMRKAIKDFRVHQGA